MARWEFHLSAGSSEERARWVWLYRPDAGDAVTSATAFATYRDCLRHALRHGYSAPDLNLSMAPSAMAQPD